MYTGSIPVPASNIFAKQSHITALQHALLDQFTFTFFYSESKIILQRRVNVFSNLNGNELVIIGAPRRLRCPHPLCNHSIFHSVSCN